MICACFCSPKWVKAELSSTAHPDRTQGNILIKFGDGLQAFPEWELSLRGTEEIEPGFFLKKCQLIAERQYAYLHLIQAGPSCWLRMLDQHEAIIGSPQEVPYLAGRNVIRLSFYQSNKWSRDRISQFYIPLTARSGQLHQDALPPPSTGIELNFVDGEFTSDGLGLAFL